MEKDIKTQFLNAHQGAQYLNISYTLILNQRYYKTKYKLPDDKYDVSDIKKFLNIKD
jgi:hypothetical protein